MNKYYHHKKEKILTNKKKPKKINISISNKIIIYSSESKKKSFPTGYGKVSLKMK